MRIRIFHAYASNNSGSYTIVGNFDSVELAADVTQALRDVCARHSAWHEQHSYDAEAESPLDGFVREHALSETRPGRDDQWPEHGDPPSVWSVGHQVFVHAPYTVTMPRLFGEYFYRRGGRVDIELNHSHEELAAEFTFYVPELRWDDPERKRRVQEVEASLQAVLPELTQRDQYDKRPRIEPVFHEGFWGSRHLTAVFSALPVGVEAVRKAAAQHGVLIEVRLSECAHGVADPLAHLRGGMRPWGTSRVILWSIGERVAAMRAVREVLGAELAEAKSAIEGLPKELLLNVDAAFAARAVQVLRDAGCDAEAVVPRRGAHEE